MYVNRKLLVSCTQYSFFLSGKLWHALYVMISTIYIRIGVYIMYLYLQVYLYV